MKSYIKLTVAALMVVGSTQVSANEGQLDLTQTLSSSIANYIEATSNELQYKLKQSLFIDSQKSLGDLLQQQTKQLPGKLATIEDDQSAVVNSTSDEG